MSDFLEQLKAKLVAAQKRQQETAAKLATAQAENTSATNELNTWNFAVHVESAREKAEELAKNPPPEAAVAVTVTKVHPVSVGNGEPNEINKTELIRDVLRQHAGGMRPVEVWQALKDQIPQRGYVYAVLGRLKGRDQVTTKRGKYTLKVSSKLEEGKTITVQ